MTSFLLSKSTLELIIVLQSPPPVITTGAGEPVGDKDAALSAGRYGPVLLKDHHLIDELAHLNRERIPSRIVHAKATGAFGYFEVTHDITKYCASKVFDGIGKKTPISARMSTVSGERGSPDTIREFRGMGVKFYTEDGNWDLVNLNTPVFSIRDPALFPSLVHANTKNPVTNLQDPNSVWDFNTLRPETVHLIMILFSDRGIPDGYRHMHSFTINIFRLVNKYQQSVFCKFHLRTAQGIRNLSSQRALELTALDPDYATRDLYNAIGRGESPSWNMFIQVMTLEQSQKFEFNPFDLTKVWPHREYPLIPVGRIVLDKNPNNTFADVEQMAFNPGNLVPGMEPAPADTILHSRMFAYPDAQRYRLGANHLQLPVNCPFRVRVANYQRDGPQTFTDNQNGAPNYFPNSFCGPVESAWARKLEPSYHVSGDVRPYSYGDTEDNFTQPGRLWRDVFNEGERNRLIVNLAAEIRRTYPFIQERAVKVFSQVDPEMGAMLATALKTSPQGPGDDKSDGLKMDTDPLLRDQKTADLQQAEYLKALANKNVPYQPLAKMRFNV